MAALLQLMLVEHFCIQCSFIEKKNTDLLKANLVADKGQFEEFLDSNKSRDMVLK